MRLMVETPAGCPFGRRGLGGRDSAEEALRERYARGEIDDETYRRMLAELRRR